jgi:hypothetical protein
MLTKPYILRGNNYAESCVVKITYGKKPNTVYVIVKCKSLPAALKNIENSLNAFIRGGKNNPDGLYYHLYNHVKTYPSQTFKVETLLESDNGYLLLKEEQNQLDIGKTTISFLNNQTEAYIPAYDESNQCYGWLTRQNVMLFKKYMKSRNKKTKKVYQSNI